MASWGIFQTQQFSHLPWGSSSQKIARCFRSAKWWRLVRTKPIWNWPTAVDGSVAPSPWEIKKSGKNPVEMGLSEVTKGGLNWQKSRCTRFSQQNLGFCMWVMVGKGTGLTGSLGSRVPLSELKSALFLWDWAEIYRSTFYVLSPGWKAQNLN